MQTVMASESHSNGISRMALTLSGVLARPDFTAVGSESRIWKSRLLSVVPSFKSSSATRTWRSASCLIAFFRFSSRRAAWRARRALFHLTIVSTLIASALAFSSLIRALTASVRTQPRHVAGRGVGPPLAHPVAAVTARVSPLRAGIRGQQIQTEHETDCHLQEAMHLETPIESTEVFFNLRSTGVYTTVSARTSPSEGG